MTNVRYQASRFVAVLAFYALPTTAEAQRPVTLAEAYRLASTQSLDLEIARRNHERADALVTQSWSALKPSVVGTGTYTLRDEATTRTFPGPTPTTITITPRDSFGASLVVTQPLVEPAAWLGIPNAQDSREAAALDVEAARQQIVLLTARTYWSVVTARRVLEVNRQLEGVANANLRAAQARLEAGTGLAIDVTRAQIDVQVAQRQIAMASAAQADAQEALGLVLGISEPIDAVDPGDQPPAVPGVDAAASDSRPDVRSAAVQQGVADRAVDAAWWSLAPTLDAQWIGTWTDSVGAFGRETQWQIVGTLTVPFYDGGYRYGVIAQREAEAAQARVVADRLSRQARNELSSARRAVETQRVAVETAMRQVDLARQALAQAQAAYEAGASTNLEVIQAQQSVRDAEVTLAIGRADWQIAVVRLLVASGHAPGPRP